MDIRSTFLLLFLGAQLVIPVSYYAHRDNSYDAYDERFAWRMFSPIRMVRCEPVFRMGGRPVNLGERYHMTWSTLAARGRPDVLKSLADDLCAHADGKPVTLTLRCKEPGDVNTTLEDGSADLCAGGGGFR